MGSHDRPRPEVTQYIQDERSRSYTTGYTPTYNSAPIYIYVCVCLCPRTTYFGAIYQRNTFGNIIYYIIYSIMLKTAKIIKALIIRKKMSTHNNIIYEHGHMLSVSWKFKNCSPHYRYTYIKN